MDEREEARAVALVVDRLRDQFPEVSAEAVEATVADCHRELEHSRIRDFVPILVENRARDHLGRIPAQRTPASDQQQR